ncbi:hypothetical protein PIB30_113341, partial [Stylosanthes scabra]|nr:hypothetical protein [Stylosanthes scabra]
AMQYPREENTEGCMRIDVIEKLIREVQEEEAMAKLQAKQARYIELDDTNHDFVLQKNPYVVQQNEELVQKNLGIVQKNEDIVQKNKEEVQKNDA